MPEGAPYVIHSVFDLFGEPVASGTYSGGEIAVPMGTKPPVQPKSDPTAISGADDPGKLFGVFVLRSDCVLGG